MSSRRRQGPADRGNSAHTMPSNPQATAQRTRTGEQRPASGNRLTNDHALYTCVCGFVFEAPVSTSVDCPHCGDKQAW